MTSKIAVKTRPTTKSATTKPHDDAKLIVPVRKSKHAERAARTYEQQLKITIFDDNLNI